LQKKEENKTRADERKNENSSSNQKMKFKFRLTNNDALQQQIEKDAQGVMAKDKDDASAVYNTDDSTLQTRERTSMMNVFIQIKIIRQRFRIRPKQKFEQNISSERGQNAERNP